jgi:hypothetical protein
MVTKTSFITLLAFISKSGRGTFSFSNFDIRLKYLFNKSHLSKENVPLPDFDIKANNVINEVFVTISEIVDI